MQNDITINDRQFLEAESASSLNVSSVLRVTTGLACVTTAIVGAAFALNLFPESYESSASHRNETARFTAVHLAQVIQASDDALIQETLNATVRRTPALRYAHLQRTNNQIAGVAGKLPQDEPGHYCQVPILIGGKLWGNLTLNFDDNREVGLTTWATDPNIRLGLFFISASCVGYYVFLRRTVGTIEATVPPHFRATIDSLTQGLVVLDQKQRILLANKAFACLRGRASEDIEGQHMRDLPWIGSAAADSPWAHTLQSGMPQVGRMMRLLGSEGQERVLRVNTAPLSDNSTSAHGVFVSFDDVTQLEERNAELTEMLKRLRDSRDQVHRQNQELQVLATRDPLTHALNRRCFFDQLKNLWSASVRYDYALSCIMLDVDHFKRVNDTHGHAVGDTVLRGLSGILTKTLRGADIVCRYGGEEFCILLPHTEMQEARRAAEKIREAVESAQLAGVNLTISAGVSSVGCGADSPEKLIDHADRSLYEAKRLGRNRVVTCDTISTEHDSDVPVLLDNDAATAGPNAAPIPFQTVSALSSALAYRDAATAEHSRRVADICVRFASDLMSMRDCYILENAALLHDIGKIGVPDSILLKPGRLTDGEWTIMRSHDRIGQEIIRSTFACDELANIVETHGTPFADSSDLCLGARVLAIADSFDSMVTDRVYRRGRSVDEAFVELRRCAGDQFDPEIVELFISTYRTRQQDRKTDSAVVNKKIALRLGMQIESLARALDEQDIIGLAELTLDILDTTAACQLDEISQLASQLNSVATPEAEWTDCLTLTLDLLECCRKAQRVHLENSTVEEATGVL